jgi:uncharacterized membrane protein YtjA (UPF0391 family)
VPVTLTYRNLGLWLFCIALVTSPLNFSVLGPFRFADVFLIFATFLILLRYPIKKVSAILFLVFLLCFIVSVINFASTNGMLIRSFPVERLVFLYKYALIFLIISILPAILSSHSGSIVLAHFSFLTLMVLGVWGVFYFSMVSFGIWPGTGRVSFPGTGGFTVSDAHLYSNVLAILTSSYIIYLGSVLKHGLIFKISVIAICLSSLWMTGSRNGLVSLSVVCLIYLSHHLFVRHRLSRQGVLVFVSSAFLTIASFVYLDFGWLIEDVLSGRVFSLELREASVLIRIKNLAVAFDDAFRNSIIFGASFFGASFLWYDSGVGIIVAHFGLFGISLLLVCLLFSGYYIVRAKCTVKARFLSFSIFLAYVVGCVITEFFLLTRSVLPAIVCIMLPLYINSESVPHENLRHHGRL